MVLWFSSFSVGVSSVNLSSALAPTLRLTPRLSHHVLNRQLHINGVGIWAEPNIKKQYCHHLVKQACTPVNNGEIELRQKWTTCNVRLRERHQHQHQHQHRQSKMAAANVAFKKPNISETQKHVVRYVQMLTHHWHHHRSKDDGTLGDNIPCMLCTTRLWHTLEHATRSYELCGLSNSSN